MLSRRSIRTKLLIVLSLMVAAVIVLAFSAFWGLYRYRAVAAGIGRLAEEAPYANDLAHSAETLREAATRLQWLRAEQALVNDKFIQEQVAFEALCLENKFGRVADSLAHYEQQLGPPDASSSLFVDPQQRRDHLAAISETMSRVFPLGLKQATKSDLEFSDGLIDVQQLMPIADERTAANCSDAEFVEMLLDINELTQKTAELTALMHRGMSAFTVDVRGEYRTWIAVAWSCLIASVAMVTVLVWLFRSLVIKPFQTLLDGSRLVASGQFSHRIDLGTGDELSELAGVMNKMTDRFQRICGTLEQERADLDRQVRDRTREVVQREQLASVGFLAAGVAHEINNPLASIAWSAEALEARLHDVIHGAGDCRTIEAEQAKVLGENLRRVQDEAYRCKGITERLLDFSRLGNVDRAEVDLSELIHEVVAMVKTLGQYRCKTVRTDCEGAVTAYVNSQQIRQVVLNLITNALESVDTDGAVDVRVSREGDRVRVTVEDNGCGMTEEVLEHLFEPFFTRRRDGSGTGLGLSITHRIVSQHGGNLTAHSDGPGRGSRLQFDVPVTGSGVLNEQRNDSLQSAVSETAYESLQAA